MDSFSTMHRNMLKRQQCSLCHASIGFESCFLCVYCYATLAGVCPADQPCRVLVLDEMQQLLAASDGPLGTLLALREQVGGNCQWQSDDEG
jgi:hypothetical protein